jgi:hypothetical protein
MTGPAASSSERLAASVRLIRNSACASRARSVASRVLSACSAARRLMTIATARNSSRFSHSFGSDTVNV